MPPATPTPEAPIHDPEIIPPPIGGPRPPNGPPPPGPGNNQANLIAFLLEPTFQLLRGIRDYSKWEREKAISQEQARQKHSFRVLMVLMLFLGSILIGVSALVYYGKVSGDALLFLIGTVTSWILYTVQRHLFESEPEEKNESFLGGLL
jgi:hypothetical protein